MAEAIKMKRSKIWDKTESGILTINVGFKFLGRQINRLEINERITNCIIVIKFLILSKQIPDCRQNNNWFTLRISQYVYKL